MRITQTNSQMEIGINMRHSNNLVMTAHTAAAGDMLELQTVRKAVSIMNAELRRARSTFVDGCVVTTKPSDAKQFYVKCQARGPRTANAVNDGKHPRAYDQSLPLRHAKKLDVYIYER